MSPASAGGFLTTVPPGKPSHSTFNSTQELLIYFCFLRAENAFYILLMLLVLFLVTSRGFAIKEGGHHSCSHVLISMWHYINIT